MIVVNYDKGFAEMLQHPAFRNRRTRRHPVDVDSSLLAPRRRTPDSRLRGDARGCDPPRHWRGTALGQLLTPIGAAILRPILARPEAHAPSSRAAGRKLPTENRCRTGTCDRRVV